MHAVSDEVSTVLGHVREKKRKTESALMLSFAVEMKQYSVLVSLLFFTDCISLAAYDYCKTFVQYTLKQGLRCGVPCMLSVDCLIFVLCSRFCLVQTKQQL